MLRRASRCCATSPRRACASWSRATRRAIRPPAAMRPRSPRSTGASWTRRPIEALGAQAAAADAGRHPCRGQDRDDIARLMGERQRRLRQQLLRRVGVADDQRDPDRYVALSGPVGPRPGRPRDVPAMPSSRRSASATRPTSRRCWAWPAGPTPQGSAASDRRLETQIAKAHWTRAESRDRDKTYNPMTLAELGRQGAGLPVGDVLRGRRRRPAPTRAVRAPEHRLPEDRRRSSPTPTSTRCKAWQAFHTADDAAPLLSKRFVDAQFEFRNKFLSGQPRAARALEARRRRSPKARWARRSAATTSQLYFPPDAKAKMDDAGRQPEAPRWARASTSWTG